MFMVAGSLRVATLTGHVPLAEVPHLINQDRLAYKLNLLLQSLRRDFGIDKPKVAVLGLNPHAGEQGMLGNEENQIISPVIAHFQREGHLVFGPFPADGFFGMLRLREYDAVLAMYHDQGLMPFKMLGFEEGVNFTAGLPIVRTSPDHGTAYDIAGKGIANENSLRSAIFLACDIIQHRAEFSLKRTPRRQAPITLSHEDEVLPDTE
jgi:4-hydroxythreonine-4-phosphate dehydrogenase